MEKTCTYSEDDLNYGAAQSHGYSAYYKIEDAQNCASEIDKPILIMFTGFIISGVSGIEWEVFESSDIKVIVEENFILVTLYVDEKNSFGNNQTLGDINLKLEAEKFGYTSQPLYVITDKDLNTIVNPIGLTRNTVEFESFLNKGLE